MFCVHRDLCCLTSPLWRSNRSNRSYLESCPILLSTRWTSSSLATSCICKYLQAHLKLIIKKLVPVAKPILRPGITCVSKANYRRCTVRCAGAWKKPRKMLAQEGMCSNFDTVQSSEVESGNTEIARFPPRYSKIKISQIFLKSQGQNALWPSHSRALLKFVMVKTRS